MGVSGPAVGVLMDRQVHNRRINPLRLELVVPNVDVELIFVAITF